MVIKFNLPGLHSAADDPDGENRVDVVCKHCGNEYRDTTYNGKMYLYEDHRIYYAFCPKCKRFNGGPVGTIDFEE